MIGFEIMESCKIYDVCEIPHKRIRGRNVKGAGQDAKPLALFWAGSGLEFRVKSNEVWALIESDFSSHESWICVFVNGRPVSRFMPQKGRAWVCLFRGIPIQSASTIFIMKDTQPMPGDPKHILLIHKIAVSGDAEFVEPPAYDMNIEFIGDSITTGEGLAGAVGEMDWISAYMSVAQNYAVRTAHRLNADFRILSQGGWGFVSGYDNNIRNALPLYYEDVCSVETGEKQRALGAADKYDFAEWRADVVVVNLSANDSGAFSNPPWRDPETGLEHKLCWDENKKPYPDAEKKLGEGVKSFLRSLRKNNPSAKIIWVWGMIETPEVTAIIQKYAKEFIEETSDKNIYTLELESMACEADEEDRGSRGHPGPKTHALAAARLSGFIKSITAK